MTKENNPGVISDNEYKEEEEEVVYEIDLPGHPEHGRSSSKREELDELLVMNTENLEEIMRDMGFSGYKDDLPDFLDRVITERGKH